MFEGDWSESLIFNKTTSVMETRTHTIERILEYATSDGNPMQRSGTGFQRIRQSDIRKLITSEAPKILDGKAIAISDEGRQLTPKQLTRFEALRIKGVLNVDYNLSSKITTEAILFGCLQELSRSGITSVLFDKIKEAIRVTYFTTHRTISTALRDIKAEAKDHSDLVLAKEDEVTFAKGFMSVVEQNAQSEKLLKRRSGDTTVDISPSGNRVN